MSYAESISLKLINNTSTDQPIGLLGGTSSTYANSDNNVLVLWDLSTDGLTGNSVTLETTTPVTVDLQTQSVKGVADALNTTNKGVFTYEGNIIYATSLLDDSVQTADLIIADNITFQLAIDTNGLTVRDSSVFSGGNVNFTWTQAGFTQDVTTDGTWRFFYKKSGDGFSDTRYIEQPSTSAWIQSTPPNPPVPCNIYFETLSLSNQAELRSYYGVPTGTIVISQGDITCYKL